MKSLTVLIVFIFASCLWSLAYADIPLSAKQHQKDLTRNSRAIFGIDAPIALFAAQIHQESRWQHQAISSAGAQGLAQFMPTTSNWLVTAFPADFTSNEPFNPKWALRALVQYNHWLYLRVNNTANECQRWGFVLSAYNGGLTWVKRDRRKASSIGLDAAYYWGAVEQINAGRSSANFNENRGYPKQIIYRWQPLYVADKWGKGTCHD